jgi:predicted TIM-barrel fold metal-dependent hydrolase
MVGSDSPVAGLHGWSYDRYLNAYRGSVRHLSPTDQEKAFLGNAMRYYRITRTSSLTDAHGARAADPSRRR